MTPYNVGILLGGSRNTFWEEMKQAYLARALEFGVHTIFAWSNPGDHAETQLAGLQRTLKGDLDAIIVNPLNRYNLVPGILEAAARGIPVLDVGAKADARALKAAEPFYTPVKTVDFYQQGIIGATYIIEKIKPGGRAKVAIIEGSKDSTQSMGRSQGAADTFRQAPAVQAVWRLSADFDRDKAANKARYILWRHPDLTAFFCANDHMALGVAETVQVMGLRKQVTIVGVDLIDEAKRAIRSGEMDASVAFSVGDVAEVILDATVKRIKGQSVTGGYPVVSRLIDKRGLVI